MLSRRCEKSKKRKTVKLNGDNLEVVKKFCYLGDMLNSEGSVHDAVIARLRVGWGKFKNLSGVLCKKNVSEDEGNSI